MLSDLKIIFFDYSVKSPYLKCKLCWTKFRHNFRKNETEIYFVHNIEWNHQCLEGKKKLSRPSTTFYSKIIIFIIR